MVQTLSPEQAERLISKGEVDVIDVRDAPEWDRGHVPRARLVPFHQLKARPRQALKRDGVLFVCARGVRSLNAARVAEEAGYQTLYNLDGGTSNWVDAGFPLEQG
ncbi:MAG: rhodanese-like domain-containing protein [Polyangiaceae bacterium]